MFPLVRARTLVFNSSTDARRSIIGEARFDQPEELGAMNTFSMDLVCRNYGQETKLFAIMDTDEVSLMLHRLQGDARSDTATEYSTRYFALVVMVHKTSVEAEVAKGIILCSASCENVFERMGYFELFDQYGWIQAWEKKRIILI